MAIQAADIKFRKSLIVSDSVNNGGRKGYTEVISGARHNLLPRVTKAERTAGVVRHRKEFLSNENTSDETAFATEVYLEVPSIAEDNIQLASGSQIDVQSDVLVARTAPSFFGVGQLNEDLLTSGTSLKITMEDATIEFPNGGHLHISDKYAIGQTIDSDVNIGDTVEFNVDTWEKASSSDDITYPSGLYLGSNVVMTIQETTNEEWLDLPENLHSDEILASGGGITNPTLAALTYATNGICKQTDKRPVLTGISGGETLTIDIDREGLCSGDCSAGELDMTDGTWTTKPVWTAALDEATDVTITYHENCFSYSGNVATVQLNESPANAYDKDNTYAGGCLSLGDVKTSSEDWTETSDNGTYDETTYPVILFNDGAVEDTFTITFDSATTFSCSGAAEGSLGTGAIGTDFTPINLNTSQPYFTIDKDGWGGTWTTGDIVTFKTHPSAAGIWIKETVPALAAAASNNLCVLGFYAE